MAGQHNDVRGALAAGTARIQAWAATEDARIRQQRRTEVEGDAAVASLSREFGELKVRGGGPLRFAGATVVFKNHHNLQLSMRDGTHFNGMPYEEAWEQMNIEAAPSGRFFISCPAHDRRISAQDNKRDLICSPNRGGWEEFSLSEVAGGKFLIHTTHGTQLTQAPDGAFHQSPNRDAWEHWSIKIIKGHCAANAHLAHEEKVAAARRAADASAAAREAASLQALRTEVDRRIAEKTAIANRIEAELAALQA